MQLFFRYFFIYPSLIDVGQRIGPFYAIDLQSVNTSLRLLRVVQTVARAQRCGHIFVSLVNPQMVLYRKKSKRKMVMGRLPLLRELWFCDTGVGLWRASSPAPPQCHRPTPLVPTLSMTKIASRKIASHKMELPKTAYLIASKLVF